MVELDAQARSRVVDAARVFVGLSQLWGEGYGCRTFYTAEDGWETAFHACACSPPTALILYRYTVSADREDEDE